MSCSPDSNSIEQLHSEMAESLERLAWSILRDWGLAADAVQETFALLAKKSSEVEPANRRGWLVKTVQFQALNLRRSQVRRERVLGKLMESAGSYRFKSSETSPIELQEEIERARVELRKLPQEQQRIVQMRLETELSFSQIASQLDLPIGTVLSRMRLALEKLRGRMKES